MYKGPMNPYIVFNQYNRGPIDENQYVADRDDHSIRNREEYSLLKHGLGASLIVGMSIYGMGIMAFYHDNNIIRNINYFNAIQANNLYTERSFMLPGRRRGFKRAQQGVNQRYESNMRLMDQYIRKNKSLRPVAEYNQYPIETNGTRYTLHSRMKSRTEVQHILDETMENARVLPGSNNKTIAESVIKKNGHITYRKPDVNANIVKAVNEEEVLMAANDVLKRMNQGYRKITGNKSIVYSAEIADAGVDGFQINIRGAGPKGARRLDNSAISFFYPKVTESNQFMAETGYEISFKGQKRYVPLSFNEVQGKAAIGTNRPPDFYGYFNNRASSLLSKTAEDVIKSAQGDGLDPTKGMSTFLYEVNNRLNSTFGFLVEKQKGLEFMPRASESSTPLLDYYSHKSLAFNNMFDMVRRNRMEVLTRGALNKLYSMDMNASDKSTLKSKLNRMLSDVKSASSERRDYDEYVNMLTDFYKHVENNGDAYVNIQDRSTGRMIETPIDLVLSSLNSATKGTLSTGYGAIFDLLGYTNNSSFQKNLRQFVLASKISKKMEGVAIDRRKFGLLSSFSGMGGEGITDELAKLGDYGREAYDVMKLTDDTAILKMKSVVTFRKDILPDGSAFILQRPDTNKPKRIKTRYGVAKKGDVPRLGPTGPTVRTVPTQPIEEAMSEETKLALGYTKKSKKKISKVFTDMSSLKPIDDSLMNIVNEAADEIGYNPLSARSILDRRGEIISPAVYRTAMERGSEVAISSVYDPISSRDIGLKMGVKGDIHAKEIGDDIKLNVKNYETQSTLKLIDNIGDKALAGRAFMVDGKSQYMDELLGMNMQNLPIDTELFVQSDFKKMMSNSGAFMQSYLLGATELAVQESKNMSDVLDDIIRHYKTVQDEHISIRDLEASKSFITEHYDFDSKNLSLLYKNLDSNKTIRQLNDHMSKFGQALLKKANNITSNGEALDNDSILAKMMWTGKDITSGKDVPMGFKNMVTSTSFVGTNLERAYGVNETYDMFRPWSPFPDKQVGPKFNLYSLSNVIYRGQYHIYDDIVSQYQYKLEETGFGDMLKMGLPLSEDSVLRKLNNVPAGKEIYGAVSAKAINQSTYRQELTSNLMDILKKTYKNNDPMGMLGMSLDELGKAAADDISIIPMLVNKMGDMVDPDKIDEFTNSLKRYHDFVSHKLNSFTGQGGDMHKEFAHQKVMRFESINQPIKDLQRFMKQSGVLDNKELSDGINKQLEFAFGMSATINKTMQSVPTLQGTIASADVDQGVALFLPDNLDKKLIHNMVQSEVAEGGRRSRIKGKFLNTYLSTTSSYMIYAERMATIKNKIKHIKNTVAKDPATAESLIHALNMEVLELEKIAPKVARSITDLVDNTLDMAEGKRKAFSVRTSMAGMQAPVRPFEVMAADIASKVNTASEEKLVQLISKAGIKNEAAINRVMANLRTDLSSNIYSIYDDVLMSKGMVGNVLFMTSKATEKYYAKVDIFGKAIENVKGGKSSGMKFWQTIADSTYALANREPSISSGAAGSMAVSIIDEYKVLSKVYRTILDTEGIEPENQKAFKHIRERLKVIENNANVGREAPNKLLGSESAVIATIGKGLDVVSEIGVSNINSVTKLDFDGDLLQAILYMDKTMPIRVIKEELKNVAKIQGVDTDIFNSLDDIVSKMDLNNLNNEDLAKLNAALIEVGDKVDVRKIRDQVPFLSAVMDPKELKIGQETGQLSLITSMKESGNGFDDLLSGRKLDNMLLKLGDDYEYVNIEMGKKYEEFMNIKDITSFTKSKEIGIYADKLNVSGAEREELVKQIAKRKGLSIDDVKKMEMLVLTPAQDSSARKIYHNVINTFKNAQHMEDDEFTRLFNIESSRMTRLDRVLQGQAQKVDLPVAFPASQKVQMLLNDYDHLKSFDDNIKSSLKDSSKSMILSSDDLSDIARKAEGTLSKSKSTSRSTGILREWVGDLNQAILNTKHKSVISVGRGVQESFSKIISGEATSDDIQAALKGDFNISRTYASGLLKAGGIEVNQLNNKVYTYRLSTLTNKLKTAYEQDPVKYAKAGTVADDLMAYQQSISFEKFANDNFKVTGSSTLRQQGLSPQSILDDASNVLGTISNVMDTKIADEVSAHSTKSVRLGDVYNRVYSYVTNKGRMPGQYNQDELSRILNLKGTSVPSTFFPIVQGVDKILPNFGNELMKNIDQGDARRNQVYMNRPGTTKNILGSIEGAVLNMAKKRGKQGSLLSSAIGLVKNKIPDTKDYSLLNRSSKSSLSGLALVGAGFLITQAIHPSPTMDIDQYKVGVGTDMWELNSKRDEIKKKEQTRRNKVRVISDNILEKEYQYMDLAERYFS